jgi:hypothetical protein
VEADPITYTYTGNDFNSFGLYSSDGAGPLTTSNFITASLTFASALPSDFNESYYGGTTGTLPTPPWDPVLLDWTISDQLSTLSYSGGDILDGLAITTNDLGQIVAWGFTAYNASPYVPTITELKLNSGAIAQNGNPPDTDGAFFRYFGGVCGSACDYGQSWDGETGTPGSWSVTAESSTPEPSTLLTGAGALLAVVLLRKRMRPV